MVLGKPARRRRSDGDRSRGAVLVEFALVLPFLLLVVFGIIEFGYAFMQNIDLRHGAREGARIAAVNYKETASPTPALQQEQIIDQICLRMDADDDVSVNLFRPGAATVGSEIQVRVRIDDYESLSGVLDFLDGITIHSTVITRAEQDVTWANMASATAFVDC